MNQTLLYYLQRTKGISRREFFEMIKEKAIRINGELVEYIETSIDVGNQLEIKLANGDIYKEKIKKLNFVKPVMIVFNKPKGYVVSKEDKHNKTIFQILPKSWHKDFYYIGRLDKNSHGLLLLTNQPDIVDQYEHPKNRHYKIYEVKIDKRFKERDISKAKKGILVDSKGNTGNKIEGHNDLLKVHNIHPRGNIITIILAEGKNRHIRRLLTALGYKIYDLKRIKHGKYELGTVKPGKYRIYKL